MSTAEPTPIHGGSARIGIQVAIRAIKGHLPQPDEVAQMLAAGINAKDNVVVHEFPFDVVSAGAMAKKERRRTFAMRAMETLLHHCGDTTMLNNDQLDRIVTQAWHVAAAMEREDMVATQLDSLGPKK